MTKILNKILKLEFSNVLKEIEEKYPDYTDYLTKIKYDYTNFLNENIPIQFEMEDNEFCKEYERLDSAKLLNILLDNHYTKNRSNLLLYLDSIQMVFVFLVWKSHHYL